MNDTGLNSSVANTSLDDTESCRACRDGAGGVDADICRGFAREGMACEPREDAFCTRDKETKN